MEEILIVASLCIFNNTKTTENHYANSYKTKTLPARDSMNEKLTIEEFITKKSALNTVNIICYKKC